MASITFHQNKDGSIAYKATITKKKLNYRETRSFPNKQAALAWADKREREVEATAAVGQKVHKEADEGRTLGEAIDKYVSTSLKAIGKTKAQVLNTIRNEYEIANLRCDRVDSTDIVNFAQELHNRPGLSSPATVLNYLSHLQAVFTIAPAAWGFALRPAEMEAAMTVCQRLGLTSKSQKRERRTTLDELDLLFDHFNKTLVSRPNSCPMVKIIAFAIFAIRRQEEVSEITWADYEPQNKRVMVRNMKHPGEKIGNDVWCVLTDEAQAIIESMPKISDRIFPYSTDAISANFTRACKVLGIENLHFHDLRHEGISRLFEMGWTLPLVATVSAHRSWQSLSRYTHIMKSGDKFENWKWLKQVTSPPAVMPKENKPNGRSKQA